jgi:hypothetical protein
VNEDPGGHSQCAKESKAKQHVPVECAGLGQDICWNVGGTVPALAHVEKKREPFRMVDWKVASYAVYLVTSGDIAHHDVSTYSFWTT